MKKSKRNAAETSASAQRFKVAVVQAAPVVFDRERTLEKVDALAREAVRGGARLVLFPEAFVSAYPRGLGFGAVIGSRTNEGREEYRRYWESSVDVPGSAVDALGRTARSNRIYLIVGVVERDRGTLYCTVLFFAPDGQFLGNIARPPPMWAIRGSPRCATLRSRGDASCFLPINSTAGAIFRLTIARTLAMTRIPS